MCNFVTTLCLVIIYSFNFPVCLFLQFLFSWYISAFVFLEFILCSSLFINFNPFNPCDLGYKLLLSVKYFLVLLGISVQFHSQLLQLQSFIPKIYILLIEAFWVKKSFCSKRSLKIKVHQPCSLNLVHPTYLIKFLSVKCLL